MEWSICYGLDGVDVYAWGRSIHDLYDTQRARISLITCQGAALLCVSPSPEDEVTAFDLGSLEKYSNVRYPTTLSVTYCTPGTGLKLTFPDSAAVQTFRRYASRWVPMADITDLRPPYDRLCDLLREVPEGSNAVAVTEPSASPVPSARDGETSGAVRVESASLDSDLDSDWSEDSDVSETWFSDDDLFLNAVETSDCVVFPIDVDL